MNVCMYACVYVCMCVFTWAAYVVFGRVWQVIHRYKRCLSRVLVVQNTFYSVRYKGVTQATYCPSEFRLFVFSRSAADLLSHIGIWTQPRILP